MAGKPELYIAAKYILYGKDLKERVIIDMYVEGTTDLMGIIMMLPFQPAENKEKQRALIIERDTSRYFLAYEKINHGQNFLVGNQFSWADAYLLEAILMLEEFKSDVLTKFPLLQEKPMSHCPTDAKRTQRTSKMFHPLLSVSKGQKICITGRDNMDAGRTQADAKRMRNEASG
uniref:glutathione transferase n=1 Tax=Laticauda laticaudata TaxID=8630 RepID=A0A8C5SEC6_LATLA